MFLDIFLVILGLGLVAKGGDLFVDSSIQLGRALRVPRFVIGGTLVSLAAALGIPSAIIGFSVIALGTSLPELVTGVTAARKGVPDLSLGNIIGANVLNLFLIVGLSATIHPLALEAFSQWYAFPWMVVFFGVVVSLIWRNGHVGHLAGRVLIALYYFISRWFRRAVSPRFGLGQDASCSRAFNFSRSRGGSSCWPVC